MDTVLNLGMTHQTMEGLARLTQNRRFALDSFRRFIQMFGNVVMNMEHNRFEEVLERVKESWGVSTDTDLNEQALEDLINQYLQLVRERTGQSFPDDPRRQLSMAILAVFDSWKIHERPFTADLTRYPIR